MSDRPSPAGRGKPLWRRGFDRAERAVGRPLEQLVSTRAFSDLLVVAFRAQGALQGIFERQTRTALHLWNLPAHTDVARLRRQVGALSAELREVSARLDEAERRRSAGDHEQGPRATDGTTARGAG